MSESLIASLGINLSAVLSQVGTDGTGVFTLDETGFISGTLSNGSGADQGNQLYTAVVTLAASGTLTRNLHTMDGAVDQLGNAFLLTKVRLIALRCMGNRYCSYVSKVANNAAGTGYLINDILAISGGTGTVGKLRVTGVGGGGAITVVAVEPFSGFSGGSYTASPSITANAVSGGAGTGATFDLTIGTYDYSTAQLFTAPVFTDNDAFSLGGDGATSALTSLFGTNTDKYVAQSGTLNWPGTIFLTSGGTNGWAVGSLTTNRNVKITNSGANPMSLRFIIIGST